MLLETQVIMYFANSVATPFNMHIPYISIVYHSKPVFSSDYKSRASVQAHMPSNNHACTCMYLSLEHPLWSDDLIKDMFPNMRVHSTQWIIQQVHISILVDGTS